MATDPIRIGYVNLSDTANGGSVTTSTAASGLPATNLQTADVKQLWRSTASPAHIIADLGASTLLHAVALVQSNMASANTVRVRVSTVDATGVAGDAYDSGSISSDVNSSFKLFVHLINAGATGRYVRVDMTQASPLPEAGRLVVMAMWAPSRNVSYGWEPTWTDSSVKEVSIGQNLIVDQKQPQRGARFRLTGLSEAEVRAEVHEINRLAGSGGDILVVLDRESSDIGHDTIWGPQLSPARYQQPRPLSFDADFQVVERL